MEPISAIVMAAGRSTRFRTKTPKVLHHLWGKPLICYILEACEAVGAEPLVLVVGHQAGQIQQVLGARVHYAYQDPPLGTGHAVMCALPCLPNGVSHVLVLPGDTPLITGEDLKELLHYHLSQEADVTILTAELENPSHYGRILRDEQGRVMAIIEARDADPEVLKIREVNTSIYCFKIQPLISALRQIKPENNQQEYYLTDVIAILAKGGKVAAYKAPDPSATLGVNNREELAQVGALLRERILRKWMLEGVTIVDPSSTYIDAGVTLGLDTLLYPGTILEGATQIGNDCRIGPYTRIVDSQVGEGCEILFSYVVGSKIGPRTRVGPFAHIRPGCEIGREVRIGNFVEVNRSQIEDGVKMSHLTYCGDAFVGEGTNIGAGTITCNYDGRRKHRTVIGKGAFIGSHTTLIAPVEIGEGAFIAAASPITQNVPPDALAIARSRQEIKEGWAKRRREGRSQEEAVEAPGDPS